MKQVVICTVRIGVNAQINAICNQKDVLKFHLMYIGSFCNATITLCDYFPKAQDLITIDVLSNNQVIDLWDGNIKDETKNRNKLPWVVSFCGGGKDEELEGDCPSRTTKRKLAGLMVRKF